MRHLAAASIAVLLSSCSRPPEPAKATPPAPAAAPQPKTASPYPDDFWQTWQDGKAEVSAYEITHPQGRATAILVFALERLSNSRRVRADNYRGADIVPVMKMNAIREDAPGSGEMLSVFAALEPVNGQPVGGTTKIVYSSWNWPGSVWRQLLITGQRADLSWHSYRGDEADGQSTRVYPDPHGIPEDSLPVCARRIAWPILRLGETRSFHVLPSLGTSGIHAERARHLVKISLSTERRTTVVPAGSFRTHTFTAVWAEGGPTKTWHTEVDPPHRIVRWETSGGETASLLGADRLTEASHGVVSPEILRKLGLQPR